MVTYEIYVVGAVAVTSDKQGGERALPTGEKSGKMTSLVVAGMAVAAIGIGGSC